MEKKNSFTDISRMCILHLATFVNTQFDWNSLIIWSVERHEKALQQKAEVLLLHCLRYRKYFAAKNKYNHKPCGSYMLLMQVSYINPWKYPCFDKVRHIDYNQNLSRTIWWFVLKHWRNSAILVTTKLTSTVITWCFNQGIPDIHFFFVQ